jgi:hypothetical protein
VKGRPIRKLATWGIGGLIGLAVLIQLVPYGRAHANPPVVEEPKWDSEATRALATRACYDCHSNQTEWRWYTSVAPASWLAQHDVDDGRRKLNFSEWNRHQREAPRAAREVERGGMPPWYYLPAHPEAQLSTTEKQALINGLRATLGDEPEGEGPENRRRGDSG